MPFDINDHSYSASQDLLDLTSKNDVIWRSTGMVMFSIYMQFRNICQKSFLKSCCQSEMP